MNNVWSNNKRELNLDYLKKYINSKRFDFKKMKDDIDIKIINDEKQKYYSLKYNKKSINRNTIKSLGLFRSVILRNNVLECFSPVKSLYETLFFETNNLTNIVAEEFIEGTMINCFYDKNERDWIISTRSVVGAKTSFLKDIDKTFKEMFEDAFTNMKLTWDMFSREYVYSLVLQHPINKIVLNIEEPTLYLVEVYKIDDFKIQMVDYRKTECLRQLIQNIKIPEIYEINNLSYEEIKEKYASMNTHYMCLGIMFKNGFERCKLRNPSYEYLHNLKGNNPKLQYQYYSLRQNNQVKDFLKHYPKYKESFSKLRDELHRETATLWKNYISCFVKHIQPLEKYGYQYRPHMIELHKKYINDLLESKKYVSRQTVINYINELPVPRLIHFMNYRIKQKKILESNSNFEKMQQKSN